MQSRFAYKFCAAILLALGTQSALADGVMRDAIGPIATGRGGTNLAFSDNGAVLNDNPAGMMNMASNGLFEAAVDTVITDIHYTDSDPNNVSNATRPMPAPMLAYFRRSDDGDWAWGIGAFAPAGFAASYQMQNSVFGPQKYMSIGAYGRLLTGAAYRVNDQLSIGAAVGLGLCHVELEGPFFLQTGALAGTPALLDLQGTGVAPTGTIGLQYQWTEDTMFGLSYTEETRFEMDGRVNALVAGVIPSRFDSTTHLSWPRSAGIGFKHNLCDCRRISADVVWYDWRHAFDSMDLTLANPSNPFFGGQTVRDSFPIDWRQSVSLRLGYEWSMSDVSIWRCGYVYHRSPTPDSTLNPFLDGVLEHDFSLGYSRKFNRCVLNLAYQFSFGPSRTVGQSAIVGNDFSNSTLSATAHWASIGLSVPF